MHLCIFVDLLLALVLIVHECQGQTNVPGCIRDAHRTRKIICHSVDLRLVTRDDISSAVGNDSSWISTVELIDCRIISLRFLTASVLSNLRSLTIDNLDPAPSTLDISVFMTFISSLEVLTMSNMPSLTSIDFLKDTTSQRVIWGSLRTLRVNGCGIASVDPDVWSFTPKLQHLSLRHNRLTFLDFEKQKGNTDLVELDASYNKITDLRNMDWNTYTRLELFNMSSNLLSNPYLLNQLSDGVKYVNLESNNLTRLSLNAIRDSMLETLILSHNSIHLISPSFSDSGRKQLKSLALNGNPNLDLSPSFLKGSTKLENLDMSSCNLRQIGVAELQNLESVITVNLSNNNLTRIEADAFQGTHELRYLYLQNNELKTLDFINSTTPSAGLGHLQILNLNSNMLRSLPDFSKAYDLRLLSIADNRLDDLAGCDYMHSLYNLVSLCTSGETASANDCDSPSFVQVLTGRDASNLLIHNNPSCCHNPAHSNLACCINTQPTCTSNLPIRKSTHTCSQTIEELCHPEPTKAPTETPVEEVITCEIRKDFTGLYASEIITVVSGYLVALLLMIVIVVWVILRNRTYNRWLADLRLESQSIHTISTYNIDRPHNAEVENVEKAAQINTLPHYTPQFAKAKRMGSADSLGSCSVRSDATYTDVLSVGKSSPLQMGGRKKFNTSNRSPKVFNRSPRNCYTNERSRTGVFSMSAGDIPATVEGTAGSMEAGESPTEMSVYSYASTLPWQQSRNHCGENTPRIENTRERSISTSVDDRRTNQSRGVLERDLPQLDILNPSTLLRSFSHRGVSRLAKAQHRNSGAPSPLASRRLYFQSHQSNLAQGVNRSGDNLRN